MPEGTVTMAFTEPDWEKYPLLQDCFDEFGKEFEAELDRLLAEARAGEREECAKLVEEETKGCEPVVECRGEDIAASIRARGAT